MVDRLTVGDGWKRVLMVLRYKNTRSGAFTWMLWVTVLWAASCPWAWGQAMVSEPEMVTLDLPTGCRVPVVLQDDLSTEFSVPGQPISGFVGQDVFLGAYPVLSRQDRLLGQVVAITAPVKGRNAMLEIRFNTLILSSGVAMPIEAAVDTGNGKEYWGGELTPGTEPEVVPYNLFQIGTYGRVMMRGEREMGQHIKFLPGSRFVVVLKNPVTLYQQASGM